MGKREIDINCRYKDYTAEVTLNKLPANDKQMSGIIAFLDYVRERSDVSVIIRMKDEFYEDDVPQAVLLTESSNGLYMELNYSMEDWEWNHSLLLANDHLTEEEAAFVLTSIFKDCTDDIPIIQQSFGEVSSRVFSEDNMEPLDS